MVIRLLEKQCVIQSWKEIYARKGTNSLFYYTFIKLPIHAHARKDDYFFKLQLSDTNIRKHAKFNSGWATIIYDFYYVLSNIKHINATKVITK